MIKFGKGLNIMKYTKENKQKMFDDIISDIENGESLRGSLRKENRIGSETFYKWIDEDETLAKRYARATEKRADAIFEEILEISNHTEEDHTPFTGSNVIQRDRLKIDARKWMLAKMNPKKYGDKIQQEIEHNGSLNVLNIPDIGNRS